MCKQSEDPLNRSIFKLVSGTAKIDGERRREPNMEPFSFTESHVDLSSNIMLSGLAGSLALHRLPYQRGLLKINIGVGVRRDAENLLLGKRSHALVPYVAKNQDRKTTFMQC